MSRLPHLPQAKRLPRSKREGGGAKHGEFALAVCGPLSGIASPLKPAQAQRGGQLAMTAGEKVACPGGFYRQNVPP